MAKIRLQRSVSLNTVFVYMALFCVSTFALLENATMSIAAFSTVKLYLMYIGFGCIVTQMNVVLRCLLKKKYFFVLLSVLILCAFLGANMLLSGGSLYSTVRFVLYLVELFALMIVLAETGRGHAALKFLFWYTLLIVFVNDTLMFTRLITFGSAKYENYIVGTKFSVSYLHMDLLTLWLTTYAYQRKKAKREKWKVLLATGFIVLVTIRTNCMTGLLGCILLAAMFAWRQRGKGIWTKKLVFPVVLLTAVAVSVIFAAIANSLMNIPMLQYVVKEVLKRSITLTGRTNIYRAFLEGMQGHWLWGFGYGKDYQTALSLFGYANVQNGLMQWILQIGVPATMAMLMLFAAVFRQLKRSGVQRQRRAMPLVMLVYIYIILAMVEVTYNMAFFMWFGLIFLVATEREMLPASAQSSGMR